MNMVVVAYQILAAFILDDIPRAQEKLQAKKRKCALALHNRNVSAHYVPQTTPLVPKNRLFLPIMVYQPQIWLQRIDEKNFLMIVTGNT
jgi:hypothetical protein